MFIARSLRRRLRRARLFAFDCSDAKPRARVPRLYYFVSGDSPVPGAGGGEVKIEIEVDWPDVDNLTAASDAMIELDNLSAFMRGQLKDPSKVGPMISHEPLIAATRSLAERIIGKLPPRAQPGILNLRTAGGIVPVGLCGACYALTQRALHVSPQTPTSPSGDSP